MKELVTQDSKLSADERKKILGNMAVIVLAQNRRVDVSLSTTSQESVRQFPFNAADSLTLLDRKGAGAEKKPAAATTKDKKQ